MASIGDIFLKLAVDDTGFHAQVIGAGQKAGNAAGAALGTGLQSGMKLGIGSALGGLSAFGGAVNKASDSVYGLAKRATLLGAIIVGGLGLGLRGATTAAEDYYRASAKIAAITGLNITQSSKLVAVFQRYGVDGDTAIRAIGMLEKNVGVLTSGLAKSVVVGRSHAATTQQIADATEKLRLAQMRLNEMQAKGVHSASSLLAAQDAVAKAERELLKLQGMRAAAGTVLNEGIAAENKFEKEFGFALRDASGNVKDANALILQAADYFTNKLIPPSKRAALEAKLFGRNWQELIPILSLGSKGIQDAGDAAAKLGLVLNAQNAGDLAAYRANQIKLAEAMAGLKLQVGLALMPVLIVFGNLLADHIIPDIRQLVATIRTWVEAHVSIIHSLKTLGDVLGTVVTRITDSYKAYKPLIDQMHTFTSSVFITGLKAISDGFAKLGNSGPLIAGLVGAVLLLNGAMRANPVVAALTGIIVTVGLLKTAWDADFGGIQEIGYTVLHKIQGVLTDLATPVRGFINTLLPAFGAVWNWLATNILPPVESVFNTIATVILPALGKAFTGIADWIKSNWPGIGTLIGHVGDVVKTAFDIIANVIKVVSPVLVAIGSVVFPAIGLAASILLNSINTAFGLIGTAWKGAGDAMNTLRDTISAAFDVIKTVVQTAVDIVTGVIGGFVKTLRDAVDWLNTFLGLSATADKTHPHGVGGPTVPGPPVPQLPGAAPTYGTGAFSGKPLPGLQSGTLNVPQTAPYLLHRGEMVVPASLTSALRSFLSGGGLQPAAAVVTNYNLYATGSLPVTDAQDAIRELRRLAGLRTR